MRSIARTWRSGADDFDPNVRARIERGTKLLAADYVELSRERARLVRAMDAQLAQFDAFVLPTTPIVAPTIAEMKDSDTFQTKNMLLLRNTSTWNFFDMCAISIPIPGSGLPVGLMLVARNGHDRRLFEIAAGIERHFGACLKRHFGARAALCRLRPPGPNML